MTAYFDNSHCDIAEFTAHISKTTDPKDVPFSAEIVKNVPVYDIPDLAAAIRGDARRSLMAEWTRVMMTGAGVIVLRSAYTDTVVLDEATAIYEEISAAEKIEFGIGGEHLAAASSIDCV